MKALPPIAAWLLAGATCFAQTAAPARSRVEDGQKAEAAPAQFAQLILRANGAVGSAVVQGDSGDEDKAGNEKAQVLEFADGNRLHGTLETLDGANSQLTWRSLDASSPITLPLAQVSHLEFPVAKAEAKVHATIKLSGGDWLTAEVTGLRDGRLQLRLADGTAMAVERARVEWIYFSKTGAPECYEGPLSLSGWASQGGWTFREGALRALQPSVIGRYFDALPDRVEYRFEYDQGTNFRAFGVLLHGPDAGGRSFIQGMVRLTINGTNLQYWVQTNDNVQPKQVDLAKILPEPPKAIDGSPPAKLKPMRWRIFEDRPAGRTVVFIDGKKVGDWTGAKSKPGENRGAVTFQPMSWNGNSEQSLSKIRVAPWDGFLPVDDAVEDTRPKTDQAVTTDGETQSGTIDSIVGDKVKVGNTTLARDKIVLLRLARPANPPDEDPAIGRVRLAQGGEFEAAGLAFRDGRLQARTNFAGALTLPVAALREVELAHLAPVPGKPVDTLVFKNGDQLRGLLETASSGAKLRWRAAPGATPVEMDGGRLAGVVLAPRVDRPAAKLGMLARLRNGDLLSGNFVSLEHDSLLLENGAVGRVTVPRDRVQAVYFGTEGRLPVLDGAGEHDAWEAGIDFNRNAAELRKMRAATGKPASPWAYFDGAFAVKRSLGNKNNVYNGNLNLGRIIEDLPPRVDFSFDVIGGKKGQVYFSAYLFTEPDSPGYVMQFHQAGMYVYDTSGQGRGRVGVQQLQIQFGDKVRMDVLQHHVRVLADRPSGHLTLLVDGVVVGQFGPKASSPPRNLARGLGLIPQQNMPVTFANLWVAPWNGQIPGEAAVGTAPSPDSVLLANGDEARGTIGNGTTETLQIGGEVGNLELPLNRLTMIELGGHADEPSTGVRLRLCDRSVLTVASYRIENETVVCQSTMAGELKFPLNALQELIFTPSTPPATPLKPGEKPDDGPPIHHGGVILQGGGGGVINGQAIIGNGVPIRVIKD